MTDPMMTIPMDAAWGKNRHRKLEIEKVDNGYIVKARFSHDYIDPGGDGLPPRTRTTATTREFVFYTDPELLEFAKNYLSAKPEDLKR